MPVNIIPTKILIPRRTSGVIRRTRLVDFLHENLERKLMLVTAPAGYGKTTLLIDFATDVELPVCWYTLDENDRDPAVFLAHLVASLQQKFPQFGARTNPLIEHGVPAAHAAAAALVADMVADVPEYFVLVLDDWHSVSDEAAISDLLDHLLRYLPEHAHLVVAGRTLLRGPLVRLAAQGAVAGIGAADLRFTADEVREVLASRFNLDIDHDQAVRLADEAEGWITAILLSSHGAWQNLLVHLPRTRDSAGPVYEYLASEVFDRLEPALQDFLLSAAVPRQFSTELVNTLRGTSDAERWIEQIELRNLFLTRVDLDGEPWYRFHPLFREFLLARFSRTSPDRFARMQRITGEAFEARNQPEEAVEYFLAANALDRAAQLMNSLARQMFISGRRQTLQSWFDKLPAAQRSSAPDLLVYEGQVLLNSGQFVRALPVLRQAETSHQERGNRSGWIRAILGQGWVAYASSKYQESLAIGQRILAETTATEEPLLTAEALRIVGDSQYGLGNWTAAEDALGRALALYRRSADENLRAFNLGRTLQDLANVLRSMGRLEECAAVQAEALILWRQIGNPGPLARCLNNLGYDRYVIGDYDGALKLYAEAQLKAEEADDRHVQARVLEGIAVVHRDRGDSRQAIDTYQQSLQLANDLGDLELVSLVLDGQGHAHRLNQDLDRASALFEQARSVAERQGLTVQVDLILASIGIVDIERGSIAKGVVELEQATQSMAGSNSYLDLGRILLWLARAQYLAGQMTAARTALLDMTRLGHRLGCRPFSLAEGKRAADFWNWALQQTDDLALRNWLASVQDQTVSHAEITVKAEAQPRLEVRAFGAGQVWRDGRALSSGEWGGSALARELFFYLLEYSPQRRDEIGAIFWPNLSAGRMASSFHAAKYKARRALGIEFAIFEGESYQLNPAADIWYDVAEFRRLIASAQARLAGEPEQISELRQALDLCTGPYLIDSYAEWAGHIREGLQQRCLEIVTTLMDLLWSARRYEDALAAAERGLEFDYFREDLHRLAMRSLVALGKSAQALIHYDKMARRFMKDLNARPDAQTRLLAKEIRAQQATRKSDSP
ncbi:MAG: tetratricopeptide repeat protein [Anaerolineae bacterium]